jgi:hypothetical protein
MRLMKQSLAGRVLIPGIRRQELIRSTSRPFYTRAKILAYPLTMRLGGPQGGSRLFRNEKIFLFVPKIEQRLLDRSRGDVPLLL